MTSSLISSSLSASDTWRSYLLSFFPFSFSSHLKNPDYVYPDPGAYTYGFGFRPFGYLNIATTTTCGVATFVILVLIILWGVWNGAPWLWWSGLFRTRNHGKDGKKSEKQDEREDEKEKGLRAGGFVSLGGMWFIFYILLYFILLNF